MRSLTLLVAALCIMSPVIMAGNLYGGPPPAPVQKGNSDLTDYSTDYSDSSDDHSHNQGHNTPKPVATPVSQLTTVAVDIHFISGDLDNQFIVYHYCSDLPSGLTQCALYDGNGPKARLIGIEEIIGADAFAALPRSERRLWHSHSYPILHGLFVLPGVQGKDANPTLQNIIDTYGRVTDIYDRNDKLPTGRPRVSYGLARDGQVNAKVAAQLDAIANDGMNYKQRAALRTGLKAKPVVDGANDYLKSKTGLVYNRGTFAVDAYGNSL